MANKKKKKKKQLGKLGELATEQRERTDLGTDLKEERREKRIRFCHPWVIEKNKFIASLKK